MRRGLAVAPALCIVVDVAETTKDATRLIDLSHTVEDGMITYKGLPAPIICDYLSREASRGRYAKGPSFRSARSSWWRIPARMSTARSTVTRMGRISRELELESLANLEAW